MGKSASRFTDEEAGAQEPIGGQVDPDLPSQSSLRTLDPKLVFARNYFGVHCDPGLRWQERRKLLIAFHQGGEVVRA